MSYLGAALANLQHTRNSRALTYTAILGGIANGIANALEQRRRDRMYNDKLAQDQEEMKYKKQYYDYLQSQAEAEKARQYAGDVSKAQNDLEDYAGKNLAYTEPVPVPFANANYVQGHEDKAEGVGYHWATPIDSVRDAFAKGRGVKPEDLVAPPIDKYATDAALKAEQEARRERALQGRESHQQALERIGAANAGISAQRFGFEVNKFNYGLAQKEADRTAQENIDMDPEIAKLRSQLESLKVVQAESIKGGGVRDKRWQNRENQIAALNLQINQRVTAHKAKARKEHRLMQMGGAPQKGEPSSVMLGSYDPESDSFSSDMTDEENY